MPEDIALQDVSMTDVVTRRVALVSPGDYHEEWERQEQIPEDLMAALEELSGDGRGRVTVGAELASNVAFGFKAGSFVSIGVTCDSNMDIIQQVHDLVHPVVQRMVEEDHAEISAMRDSILPPGESDKALNLETGSKPAPKVEEKTTTRPKKSKPSFRR